MERRKAFFKNYLPLLIMLSALLVIGTLLLTGKLTITEALNYAKGRPAVCAAVLLLLFVVKGFSVVIPHSVLCAAAGVVFDTPVALVLNAIGTLLCLTVSYGMGYFTRTTTLEQALARHPKIQRHFTNAKEFGFGFSYTLHVLGLSTEVLGVLFGLMRLEFWKYMLSSFLAIAPGMACFTIIGSELSVRSPILWGIVACDLVIITACTIHTRRRLRRGAHAEEEKNT